MNDEQSIIISDLTNIRYLCGFSGSNAALLITPEQVVLATDSRYQEQAQQQVTEVQVVVDRDLIGRLLKQISPGIVSVESKHVSIQQFAAWRERFPKYDFVNDNGTVEALRVIKDDIELNLMGTACEISTQALHNIIPTIQIGQSERDLALQIEIEMRKLGADDRAFDTIVAFGPNSAIPHHEPTVRTLASGDLVKIDFGAKVSGYHADCTRTFVMGKPSKQQQEIHSAVLAGQRAGRDALIAGVELREVVESVSDSLAKTGYRDRFTHGLGHGVGLAIHEDPFFGALNTAKIEANTVITVEPGVYLPGFGGVRIEDTVVVTSDGYRNLTNFPYELLEL